MNDALRFSASSQGGDLGQQPLLCSSPKADGSMPASASFPQGGLVPDIFLEARNCLHLLGPAFLVTKMFILQDGGVG